MDDSSEIVFSRHNMIIHVSAHRDDASMKTTCARSTQSKLQHRKEVNTKSHSKPRSHWVKENISFICLLAYSCHWVGQQLSRTGPMQIPVTGCINRTPGQDPCLGSQNGLHAHWCPYLMLILVFFVLLRFVCSNFCFWTTGRGNEHEIVWVAMWGWSKRGGGNNRIRSRYVARKNVISHK